MRFILPWPAKGTKSVWHYVTMAHTFPTIVILSEDEKGIHTAQYGSFTTKWNDEPKVKIGPKWSILLWPLDDKETLLKEIERRNQPDYVFPG